MPYTYQGWTLYSREVKLKKGPKVTIYFFSKRKPKSGKAMDEMPKGRKGGVNMRTGLPFLRKALWRGPLSTRPGEGCWGDPRHLYFLRGSRCSGRHRGSALEGCAVPLGVSASSGPNAARK